MNMIDTDNNNNENLNPGSISSTCSRQVGFPDDEHAHMEYENQVEGKLKCLIQKRSNTNVSKMLSPEYDQYEPFKYQFTKSEPIYIHQEVQTPSFSSYSSSNKTVFSSSSSSSACSTSPSPSHHLAKSYEDNDDDDHQNSRKQGRGNRFFPDNVVEILNKWFFENQDYPYPDDNMTNALARDANISAKQVRKWFANKRVRSNKCYKQTFRTKLNTTPCSSLKQRRTKSTGEQDLNDEASDSENANNSLNLSPQSQSTSPFHQDERFYENLIRNFHQQQQLNMIHNAIYNSSVIANLLQTNLNSPTSGIVKRKTHLSNCFINDQLMSESSPVKSPVADTEETVFQPDKGNVHYYQFQYQLQQLIQQQQQQQQQLKKPKVNFGLVSDLI